MYQIIIYKINFQKLGDKIAYPKLENRRCEAKLPLQNRDSYKTYTSLREAEIECAKDVNCHGIYEPGCERGNTGVYSTKDNIRLCDNGNAFTEEHGSCVYQKGNFIVDVKYGIVYQSSSTLKERRTII